MQCEKVNMNVLWITNTIFPALCRALNMPEPVTGGWMYNLSGQLAASGGIKLAVATVYSGRELKKIEVDGTLYYLLPCKSRLRYQKSLEPVWKEVCKEFAPDAVHIHGTEYAHGLACMKACSELNYVVSIQGLASVCARYYYGGISIWDILANVTFRDIVRLDTLIQAKRNCKKRGEYEKEYLKLTNYVIGRTAWDFSHTRAVNPNVNYCFCNESLRKSFYSSKKWDISRKTNHSIFLSQANYPIKGLHQVLKAVNLLKTEFPDITLRVAGGDITKYDTCKDKAKLSGYGKYIRSLIKKMQLQKNIKFVGSLNESQMVKEYLNSNVFICPSSSENSPNSLGESQLLGVPCIASYVGGVPDMVSHGETGLLYRFEEVEMLAENIRTVFTDDDLAVRLSLNGIVTAEQRHDRQTNLLQTLRCYSIIDS